MKKKGDFKEGDKVTLEWGHGEKVYGYREGDGRKACEIDDWFWVTDVLEREDPSPSPNYKCNTHIIRGNNSDIYVYCHYFRLEPYGQKQSNEKKGRVDCEKTREEVSAKNNRGAAERKWTELATEINNLMRRVTRKCGYCANMNMNCALCPLSQEDKDGEVPCDARCLQVTVVGKVSETLKQAKRMCEKMNRAIYWDRVRKEDYKDKELDKK